MFLKFYLFLFVGLSVCLLFIVLASAAGFGACSVMAWLLLARYRRLGSRGRQASKGEVFVIFTR